MGVSVEHGADGKAGDRILEAAAAEKRIDVARLSLDGALDRRVVEQGDEPVVAQARERGFELQRFVDRFVDELLDDLLAPRAQRPAPESAGEPLDAGEADPVDLRRLAVQRDDSGVAEDLGDLGLLTGFEVVVAKDCNDRNLDRRDDLLDEGARLFDEAVVGHIAAQGENVRRLAHLGKKRLPGTGRRGAAVVNIANRGDANDLLGRHAPGVRARVIPAVRSRRGSYGRAGYTLPRDSDKGPRTRDPGQGTRHP